MCGRDFYNKEARKIRCHGSIRKPRIFLEYIDRLYQENIAKLAVTGKMPLEWKRETATLAVDGWRMRKVGHVAGDDWVCFSIVRSLLFCTGMLISKLSNQLAR